MIEWTAAFKSQGIGFSTFLTGKAQFERYSANILSYYDDKAAIGYLGDSNPEALARVTAVAIYAEYGKLQTPEIAFSGHDDLIRAQVAALLSAGPAALAGRQPQGGVYILVNNQTGKVVYVGRTTNFDRREAEHNKGYPGTRLERLYPTDVYAEQRGLEHQAYMEYGAASLSNKLRPISPNNPNYQLYIDAANQYKVNHP